MSKFKQFLIIIGMAILVLLISSYYWSSNNNSEKNVKKISDTKKEIYIRDARLAVDVADEPHEQTRGLSGKEYMAADEGMIFIFPASIIPPFWMKDMKFGLDIIWVDANNTIIGIEKNVLPDTFPKTFSPSSPIKYVIEVNSGWSDKNSIKVGDPVSF